MVCIRNVVQLTTLTALGLVISGAVGSSAAAAAAAPHPVTQQCSPKGSAGDALVTFQCLKNFGVQKYEERRLTDAEPPLLQALALVEQLADVDPKELATLLNTLVLVEKELGKFDNARRFAERNLKDALAATPPDPRAISERRLMTGIVEANAGNYTVAEDIVRKVLVQVSTLQEPDPELELGAKRYLGNILERRGRLEEAERTLSDAIALARTHNGDYVFELSSSLSDLSFVFYEEGKLPDAEIAARQSLELREASYGPDSASVADILSQLGMIYTALRRFPDSESAYKRAITISENLDGPENLRAAAYKSNLGLLYSASRRHGDAIALLEQAYNTRLKTLGKLHDDTANARNNLATAYTQADMFAKAAPLLKENVRYYEKVFGKRNPNTATAYNNLGSLYQGLRKNRQAESYYKKALAIAVEALGYDDPSASISRQNLAGLFLSEGDWKRAAEMSTETAASVIRRIRRGSGLTKEMSAADATDAARQSQVFDWMILSTFAYGRTTAGDTTQLTERAFIASQWNASSAAASALTLTAARQARGSGRLGTLIREREDKVARWHDLDGELTALITSPSSAPERVQEVRAGMAEIDQRVAAIDAELVRDYPDYMALARPEPLTLPQLQTDLAEGETMLFYVDTAAVAGISAKTFLWVIDKRGASFLTLDETPDQIASQIRQLREAIGTGGTGRGAVGLDEGSVATGDDLSAANRLYEVLVAPVAESLKDTHTLFIVPSRSLAGLPFQLLVTSPPQGEQEDPYKQASWLIRRFAIEIVPSVAALHSLRQVSKPSVAKNPYLGIGNPILATGPARQINSCESNKPLATKNIEVAQRSARPTNGNAPSTASLLDLPSLPETAFELCTVAQLLGAAPSSVLLGQIATEREMKALSASGSLERARILHFATHGLTTGEIPGLSEPALVLTPPNQPTPDDDGLLTASEVSALKLDADWVVLSACNTAASERGNGDLLSGLARAFFYAGARALLVSNWQVNSEAAVALTTGTVRNLADEPQIGKAEALRRSMLEIISQGGYQARPSYWAPFSLVGGS